MNEEISNRVAFCLQDIKHVADAHTNIMRKNIWEFKGLSPEEKEWLLKQAVDQYKKCLLGE